MKSINISINSVSLSSFCFFVSFFTPFIHVLILLPLFLLCFLHVFIVSFSSLSLHSLLFFLSIFCPSSFMFLHRTLGSSSSLHLISSCFLLWCFLSFLLSGLFFFCLFCWGFFLSFFFLCLSCFPLLLLLALMKDFNVYVFTYI